MPLAGFEPQNSGVGSYHSTNRDTTTAPQFTVLSAARKSNWSFVGLGSNSNIVNTNTKSQCSKFIVLSMNFKPCSKYFCYLIFYKVWNVGNMYTFSTTCQYAIQRKLECNNWSEVQFSIFDFAKSCRQNIHFLNNICMKH